MQKSYVTLKSLAQSVLRSSPRGRHILARDARFVLDKLLETQMLAMSEGKYSTSPLCYLANLVEQRLSKRRTVSARAFKKASELLKKQIRDLGARASRDEKKVMVSFEITEEMRGELLLYQNMALFGTFSEMMRQIVSIHLDRKKMSTRGIVKTVRNKVS